MRGIYLLDSHGMAEKNKPTNQCVVCNEKLSNHAMKPLLLQCNFNTKHALFKDKPLEFFLKKINGIETQ